MRKIDSKSIVCFSTLFIPTTAVAIVLCSNIVNFTGATDSQLTLKLMLSVPSVFFMNIFVYRIFLRFRPLKTGYYREHSPEEFTYNVYVLYYLLLFNPLLPTLLIPIPIMRFIYILLGAKLGDNTYSSGVILDPPLVKIGDNTILGFDSVICPHAVEGNKVYFDEIQIGHRVTVGMRSIIMAGCVLEDDAIVAAGSVVVKGTHIKKGEVWAGVPARKLRDGSVDKLHRATT